MHHRILHALSLSWEEVIISWFLFGYSHLFHVFCCPLSPQSVRECPITSSLSEERKGDIKKKQPLGIKSAWCSYANDWGTSVSALCPAQERDKTFRGWGCDWAAISFIRLLPFPSFLYQLHKLPSAAYVDGNWPWACQTGGVSGNGSPRA